MTDGGDVLDEGIVLNGEVVGCKRLAQTLTTFEKFLNKKKFVLIFVYVGWIYGFKYKLVIKEQTNSGRYLQKIC